MLTHRELLEAIAEEGKYTFISTGMSTLIQITKAIKIFKDKNCPFELMYCNSTYPMPVEEANLNAMLTLKKTFDGVKVGYSGHETGLIVSCAAVAMGASSIERHITLDRAMYGSDQSASVEVTGMRRLVDYVRNIELAMGSGFKPVTDKEKEIAKKLRRVDTL